MKDSIFNFINTYLEKVVSQKKAQKNLSFLENLEPEIILEDDKSQQSLQEQLEGVKEYKVSLWEKITYFLSSFYKRLFIVEFKNYKTGEVKKGVVRASNRIEANLTAKKLYKTEENPNRIQEIELSSSRLLDKIRVNPTFFMKREIDKLALGEFLVEYASLMQDGLSKKDSIKILKENIKDKNLKDFLEALEGSSFKMYQLMKQAGVFDEYTIAIVESAEVTGSSTLFYDGLSKLGESYIQQETFRRNFIKSLYYPGFLITLVFIIWYAILKFVMPALSGVFLEITSGKLPEPLIAVLELGDNLHGYILRFLIFVWLLYIVKKILFTNIQLLIRYELYKLRIPLLWPILQKIEENRAYTIMIQTMISQMSPLQKIRSFQKASSSELYKKVYQYMAQEFQRKQNLTSTFGVVNDAFWAQIFSDRALLIMEIGGNDTKKRLEKYTAFLEKNTVELKKLLNKVQKIVLTIAVVGIAWAIGWVFMLILWTVIDAVSSI